MPRPPLTKAEASALVSDEYKQLKNTYSILIKSVSLTREHDLNLTTLEGERFIIRVSSQGWRVLKGGTVEERKRTWEMVEDLLRSVSPRFKVGWDEILLEKLRTLLERVHGEADQIDKARRS
jgi:hypothetical protein